MIHSYEFCKEKNKDTGRVVATRDYIVHVEGLEGARINEAVAFENGEKGYVTRIDEEHVWVVVFSKETMELGTKAARSGKSLMISCGDGLLGHVVSSLGYVIDGNKELSEETDSVIVDKEVLGVDKRQLISKPLFTGITMVDLAIPLGEGQRELVIGERKTGKSWLALQTLAKQAKEGKVGIYCAIGKQANEIASVKEWFENHGVLDKIVIVAASARENPAEVILAPLTAMSMAENFRDKGTDTLVVLDDMTTHAKYYREMSLLMGRFPGRDSYPGDIFYFHSKLLERAGCFVTNHGPKSISCLALAETIGGDMTGYIQTNLMSITDGHIYFDIDRFQHGVRPAINMFLSVTRVGRQTRGKLLHGVATEIYGIMKKVEKAKMFTKFGPEQTEEVKQTLIKGENLEKFLTQANSRIYEEWEMLFLFAWYRMDKKVDTTPEELMEKFAEKGMKKEWIDFVRGAESTETLTNFVNKKF